MQKIIAHQEDVRKVIINNYIKRQAINQYKSFDKKEVENQKKYIKTRRNYN